MHIEILGVQDFPHFMLKMYSRHICTPGMERVKILPTELNLILPLEVEAFILMAQETT